MVNADSNGNFYEYFLGLKNTTVTELQAIWSNNLAKAIQAKNDFTKNPSEIYFEFSEKNTDLVSSDKLKSL